MICAIRCVTLYSNPCKFRFATHSLGPNSSDAKRLICSREHSSSVPATNKKLRTLESSDPRGSQALGPSRTACVCSLRSPGLPDLKVGLYSTGHKKRPQETPHPQERRVIARASRDEAVSPIVERRTRWTSHRISFQPSGQLSLEEYYVLAIVDKAGLNPLHASRS